MNFTYEENEQKLKEYIGKCRERIKNTFFDD